MISSVRGVVLAASGTTVVVEVGGIGLSVAVTSQHALALRVGAETRLHTALIVREDDLALYGFRDGEELDIFDLLRGVTGVGPKSALGVLAGMSPHQVATAVLTEDDGAFRKVSGIGPKTAKQIVLSLAGKIKTPDAPTVTESSPPVNANVLNALIGLGWSERIAAQAIDDAVKGGSAAEVAAVPSLLRLALAQLGPGHGGSARSSGDQQEVTAP